MKTIEIEWSEDYSGILPDNLINITTLGDILEIREIVNTLEKFKEGIFSINLDKVIFDLPDNSMIDYSFSYLTCYFRLDEGITVYQYFQVDHESSFCFESEGINLDKLEEYLTKH